MATLKCAPVLLLLAILLLPIIASLVLPAIIRPDIRASFDKALTPPTNDSCPYNECIHRCVVQYGGDGSSGNSYQCTKGCVGIRTESRLLRSNSTNVRILDPTKFCSVLEAGRYGFCLNSCESTISEEASREPCKYGCEFWQADTNTEAVAMLWTNGVATRIAPSPTPPLSSLLATDFPSYSPTTEWPTYSPTTSYPTYTPTAVEKIEEEVISGIQTLDNTEGMIPTGSPIGNPTMPPSLNPMKGYQSSFPVIEEYVTQNSVAPSYSRIAPFPTDVPTTEEQEGGMVDSGAQKLNTTEVVSMESHMHNPTIAPSHNPTVLYPKYEVEELV